MPHVDSYFKGSTQPLDISRASGFEPRIVDMSYTTKQFLKKGLFGWINYWKVEKRQNRCNQSYTGLTEKLADIVRRTGVYFMRWFFVNLSYFEKVVRVRSLFQEPVLFSGTLRMNLDPTGQYQDEEIWSAVKMSNLTALVNSQPEQLEQECSEGGENLRSVPTTKKCI